jgi:hypothetical protein
MQNGFCHNLSALGWLSGFGFAFISEWTPAGEYSGEPCTLVLLFLLYRVLLRVWLCCMRKKPVLSQSLPGIQTTSTNIHTLCTEIGNSNSRD